MRLALCLCLPLSLCAADFPKPFNTGTDVGLKPMPADEAVKRIKLPDGFKATVFAAEPDVQNPIACAWDSRGRLWIAENYSYADAKTGFDKTLRDRILIFEDTDNDGRHDKRTVFADNLHNLTSIELGYGGVYATAAPHLLWIPDRDGDDRPDTTDTSNTSYLPGTSYEILLDGFDAGPVRHNLVNGLRWGPDGWLYGRHGILATSRVGAPGTPDAERVPLNVGIWRFHPVRRMFEIVCWGGTNPWGLDWNAEGEGFFTNTVIGHVYHLIPGAHYERMYGQDPNPHIYQLLPQTADHFHFDTSKKWTESRDGKANDFGGGHAHCGAMIYLGENWPAQYRGKLFTINLHGRCINTERIERKGSGYVIKHEPDFATFGDPWFRGIDLTYGPDGAVYVLDWSDQGECHENDGVHRESGRIYKIVHGEAKRPEWLVKGASPQPSTSTPEEKKGASQQEERASGSAGAPPAVPGAPPGTPNVEQPPQPAATIVSKRPSTPDASGEAPNAAGGAPALPARPSTASGDLAALSDEQLMKLAIDGSEWESRVARRLMATRAATAKQAVPKPDPYDLRALFAGEVQRVQRVRELLAIHASGKLSHRDIQPFLHLRPVNQFDEHLVAWIVRLTAELPPDPTNNCAMRIGSLAVDSGSKLAMLAAASTASRLSKSEATMLILQLIRPNVFDPDDLVFAATAWNVLRNADENTLGLVAQVADRGPLARWMHRRVIESHIGRENMWLILVGGERRDPESIVLGFYDGLRGVPKTPEPEGWNLIAAKAAAIPALADKVRELNVIFGDGRALGDIRAMVLDPKADFAARVQGVGTLAGAKVADLRATLEQVVKADRDLIPAALIALATLDDSGPFIVENYPRALPDKRAGIIAALCTRAASARALLGAVAGGRIARADITAYDARQIASLGDADLSKQLADVWGTVGSTTEQKKKRIAELKAEMTPDALKAADIAKGRVVYTQLCAACHTLYDLGQSGTNLGPNLTGSGRGDLHYLLENIVDPSLLVPADYKLSIVTLKDGRVLSGFIAAQNDQTLTLRTMTDTQTLPRAEVQKTETSPQSLMPEGQLDTLTPEQRRDLFGFLMKK